MNRLKQITCYSMSRLGDKFKLIKRAQVVMTEKSSYLIGSIIGDADLLIRRTSLVPNPQALIILEEESSVLRCHPYLCSEMGQWLNPLVPSHVVEKRVRVTVLSVRTHNPV